MNTIQTLIFSTLLACSPAAATRAQDRGAGDASPKSGTRQTLLADWQFSKDSSTWAPVAIPHCYNATDGHSPAYYRGKGYYTRLLRLGKPQLSEPLFLLFEGAAQQATVFVNGHKATHHYGGYTPFVVPLKGLVKAGDNTITVVCDNHEDTNLIPVQSDFNKNGGLHNPVWLLAMSPVYLSPQTDGLYHLHVATPSVSKAQAHAVVSATLCNADKKGRRVGVTFSLSDDGGHVVASLTKHYALRGGQSLPVSGELTVAKPHLWDGVADPYRYKATIRVSDSRGRGLDEASAKVGFRFFEATRDGGFRLNGHPYPLRGVAEHQDLDGKATAMTQQDIDRDYAIITELGCNFLRLAHYPHRDYEYSLCDSLGIIVQTEIPWVNVCGQRATPQYFDHIHSQMDEMIANLYNHPSIVFWGMWNELDTWGNNDQYQGALDSKRVVAETGRLYDLAKQRDPYRLCGLTDCSMFRNEGYKGLKADFYSENRYNGWYYNQGDFGQFTDHMNTLHRMMGLVNVSEYGAGVNPFCHTWSTDIKAMRQDDKKHYEEYGNLLHESHVRQIMKMPFLNFSSAWVLFDFPVSGRQEGYLDSSDGVDFTENDTRKYMNDKGLVTRDRLTKKDVFYLYKALWNKKEKTVYITSRRRTVAPQGATLALKVYSNATSLDFYLDGRRVQTLDTCPDPTGVIWQFSPVTLAPGDHRIAVIGDGVRDEMVLTQQ